MRKIKNDSAEFSDRTPFLGKRTFFQATMEKVYDIFERFWQQCPALLYGIALALGCAYALGSPLEASFVWLALLTPLLCRPPFSSKQFIWRLASAALLCACTAGWVHQAYALPSLPSAGIKGQAVVAISSIANQAHPFGARWIYRGTLLHFIQEGREQPAPFLKNVPLTVSLPDQQDVLRPPATSSYLITGALKATQAGNYFLQTSKQQAWLPLKNAWSSAEMRYQLKQSFAALIKENYQHQQSQSFLSGIATGEFDDRLLAQDFSRFGLQHIMAISGFHFSIIASFFSLILGVFLPKRAALLLLIFLLSSYFLFLGATASIMRAWIMCLVACLGLLFERQPYGLNSLGVALMGVILYDPLQVYSLGFQFSFATTAAILLLYAPIDQLLQKVFQKRRLEEALEMPLADRHAYIILSIIRQGLSLTLAVNLIALPLTLFYFQKFPLMSLLFNLFFPFLVSIAIIFLLAGLGLTLVIPPLGRFIHHFNDFYTQLMLNFTTYTPKAFDLYLRAPELPPFSIVAIVTVVFCAGIYYKARLESQSSADWAFV